ncbi:hypothetical protein PtrSN002B_007988 [Pyrenophora tritici-repentis]|nr:hypothetical protein PtrV1_09829 [Pyrenophora tritici-repentis]KAI1530551.1 hypothetical protein PtrSN001A_008098 [Pyrenophora tritici-repentis]KAI1542951.1 hypothetical protein PtrSN002B_007988 [Pyrenophora tritici-repentis]KAI1585287.1 hypothetical protein PtrEW13061_008061 [Pyrenophora tritici-repentis]KAI1663519.1 hypothetical protein L13192_12474 [Pyrenophora tritici-repentis]
MVYITSDLFGPSTTNDWQHNTAPSYWHTMAHEQHTTGLGKRRRQKHVTPASSLIAKLRRYIPHAPSQYPAFRLQQLPLLLLLPLQILRIHDGPAAR